MAQVHRFHDFVAAFICASGTDSAYMTASDARTLGNALLACAASVDREPFGKSRCLTVEVDTGNASLADAWRVHGVDGIARHADGRAVVRSRAAPQRKAR